MYAYPHAHIQIGPACKMPQTSYTTPALRHAYVYHCLFIWVPCVPWLIHMCTMTHLYVCHDSMLHITPSAPFVCTMTHSYEYHDSFICVPWLIHMCAMTHCCTSLRLHHSYACHDTHIYTGGTCYTTPAMRHAYVYHCLFIWVPCVPWLIHICTMTHLYVCHGSFIWGCYD